MANKPQSNLPVRDRNLKQMSVNSTCKKTDSSSSIGSFNRLRYDTCTYNQDLTQSTDPLNYQMTRYKFENCSACTYEGKYYAPFDLVDFESELRNITRPGTQCDSLKYSPTCEKSESCVSTFEKSNPVVLLKDVCPVVCNNIKRSLNTGTNVRQKDYCKA